MTSTPEDNEPHSNSSVSSDEEERETFAAVMENIRLDRLAEYASNTRKRCSYWTEQQEFHVLEIGAPMFGSYHVLYPVKFNDGVRWLLKVPSNGTKDKFNETSARALRSEARTMRCIKQKTTIPIPTVYSFSDTYYNELNCPFILLEFMDGKPLYDVWFDKTQPKEIVHARRTRCLQDLAAAMVQLGQFSFKQAGSIMINEVHDDDIGPLRQNDFASMLQRRNDEGYDGLPIFVERGPFSDPKEYYTALLSSQDEPANEFDRGQLKLLQLLVDWIPEPEPTFGYESFVLAHDDLDVQNILVAEDGTLKAIIDWDGISAVPRSVGNERYPSWLTRDWDPAMYGWNEDMDRGIEPKGLWEDSPETLRRYRSIYAESIRALSKSPNPNFNLTRNSVVCENILIAVNDPLCTFGILENILKKIENIVREDISSSMKENGESNGEEGYDRQIEDDLKYFEIFQLSWALGDDELSDRHLQLLKDAFHSLLNGEQIL
jgi:Phosphotransferase enzyme family